MPVHVFYRSSTGDDGEGYLFGSYCWYGVLSDTHAQLSAYGQMVAKATTTIGLSGDHSFPFVSDCKETLNMCDAKVHFPSELASELFWCRKFCQPFCPMVCPETVWVVFSAKILYENLSICFVYSGSCPEVSVIEGKSPSSYFDNTTI